MNTKNLVISAFTAAPLFLSAQAYAAAACEANVEVTAAMAFTAKAIDVPKSCKTFTVNLKAQGTMAKTVMGHNFVITKEADKDAVNTDGMTAGAASNYVKAKDARVVANTIVIGGGESASTKFDVKKLSAKDKYVFFCSFPGHAGIMKGVINLV
jgi:azurin